MMPVIALLTGACMGTAIYLMVRFLLRSRFEQRLIGTFTGALRGYDRGLTGIVLSTASLLGGQVRRVPSRHVERFAGHLRSLAGMAGGAYAAADPYLLMGTQVLAGVCGIVAGVTVLGSVAVPALVLYASAGGYAPYALLSVRARERSRAVLRQLPDALDLLALMSEAGLDLWRAFDRVTETLRGPLIDELQRARGEISLGSSRAAALSAVGDRVGQGQVKDALMAIVEGAKTGGSMAGPLRALAARCRQERYQEAERLAGQAPLKLMLPLVLLIFPTVFIILFGPVLLSFLGGGLF